MPETNSNLDTVDDDDCSNRTIQIHPDFAEGDVVLKPTEGLCFLYQLSRLAELSTFFHDLSDLPLPEGKDHNVIPFPETSEAVLRFSLEFIEYQRSAKAKLPALDRCEILSEILEFWDIFGLSSLLLPLYAWSTVAYKDKPEVAYALSWHCLPEDCPPADERDGELRDQLASRIGAFEPWALAMLEQYRPNDYFQVYQSRELYGSGQEIFRRKFLSSGVSSTTFMFGARCWSGCPHFLEFNCDYQAFLESIFPNLSLVKLLCLMKTEKRGASCSYPSRTRLSLRYGQISWSDLRIEGVHCQVCRNRIESRVQYVLVSIADDVHQRHRHALDRFAW